MLTWPDIRRGPRFVPLGGNYLSHFSRAKLAAMQIICRSRFHWRFPFVIQTRQNIQTHLLSIWRLVYKVLWESPHLKFRIGHMSSFWLWIVVWILCEMWFWPRIGSVMDSKVENIQIIFRSELNCTFEVRDDIAYAIKQIAKTIGSTSVRHPSDTLTLIQCLNEVDPKVYAMWDA